MTTEKHFIVVFDDQQGARWPMCWDAGCAGALFASRAEARQAIRISTAYAKLCRAQGKPANDDFLEGIAYVKVVACATKGAA